MFQYACVFNLKHDLLIFISSSFSYPLHPVDKLQTKLKSEGGIKALLGIVRCEHPDVLSQVARGLANFAKCESRTSTQGRYLK